MLQYGEGEEVVKNMLTSVPPTETVRRRTSECSASQHPFRRRCCGHHQGAGHKGDDCGAEMHFGKLFFSREWYGVVRNVRCRGR